MNPETVAALQRINREFYERRAGEFSATRARPWPAWRRVAELCEEDPGMDRLPVLDLGCGNGRLGRFLAARWGERLGYVGVDASRPMLAIARSSGCGGRLVRADLVRDGLPGSLPGESFRLVAAFGLMHHLPGFDNRAALLRAAAGAVAPGGLLAISFWQFGDAERFRRRRVSWRSFNRTAAEPIDARELEEGDALLAWGPESAAPGRPRPVRYCHWTRPAEADRLLTGLPLEPLASFRADGEAGDLNLYRILRRPRAQAPNRPSRARRPARVE